MTENANRYAARTRTHVNTHLLNTSAAIKRRSFTLVFINSRHKPILGRASEESILQTTDSKQSAYE